MINRLKPFDATDAALFIRINHLPHPRWLDGLIARFSWTMTGGHAWILVVLADALFHRRRAMRTALAVLPCCISRPILLRFPSRNISAAAGRSSRSFVPLSSGENRAAIPSLQATVRRPLLEPSCSKLAIHAAEGFFSRLRFSLHSHAFIWAHIILAMSLAEVWSAPPWQSFIEACSRSFEIAFNELDLHSTRASIGDLARQAGAFLASV